jgi:hypothetical protein
VTTAAKSRCPQHLGRLAVPASWCLYALFSACSSSQVAERPSAPATPPAAVEAPAPQVSPAPPQIASSELPSDPQPATVAGAPPCECALPKSEATPKHRHRSAPHKVTPPPPPYTVGSDVAMPSAAVVNAQVGEIGSGVTSILGRKVHGPQGEDLGRVVDILADANGRVRVAIIDFGGFLGVGSRRIAVDWPLLRFDPGGGDKSLILSVSREKLQSAPEYKDSARPRVLMPPAATSSATTDSTEVKK